MATTIEKKRTWKISHNEEGFNVLTITEVTPRKREPDNPKKEVTHFALHRNPNQEGAWDLAKLLDGGAVDVYNVSLDSEESTCTCHWGEFRANSSQRVKHCRHVACLLEAEEQGKLPEQE